MKSWSRRVRTKPAEIGPLASATVVSGVIPPPDLSYRAARLNGVEIEQLIAEGLGAPTLSVIERARVAVSPENYKILRQATDRELMRTLAASAAANQFLATADLEGIKLCLIKGAAVSGYFPDLSSRTYTDVDLIVEPSDFGNFLSIACRSGFRPPPSTEPAWNSFLTHCREGINLHSSFGNLDIHHHLSPWIFGSQLSAVDILESGNPAGIGNNVCQATAEHSAVIAAIHILNDLWKGQLGLKSLRDLVILGEHLGRERLSGAFTDVGSGWLLALLIERYEYCIIGTTLASARVNDKPSISNQLRLYILGWYGLNAVARSRISWMARLPLHNGLLYLFGSIVPNRSWVRAHHKGYFNFWSTALRLYRKGTPGRDARR